MRERLSPVSAFAVGLFMLISAIMTTPARAFDPVASAAYFKAGVDGAKTAWRESKNIWNTFKHQWWVIEYADGYKIFNRFKAKRGPDDVYSHATGHGDCDWWWWPENASNNHVCLTSPYDAKRISKAHRGIISIRPIDHPGVLYGH